MPYIRKMGRFKKVFDVIINVLFVVYLLVLIGILLLGLRGGIYAGATFKEYYMEFSNFIPFKTILTYIKYIFTGQIDRSIPIKNLLGNLALFMPMGAYMGYKNKNIRLTGIIVLVTLLILEALQLVLRRGSFDIDDFILNISGAVIANIVTTRIIHKKNKNNSVDK